MALALNLVETAQSLPASYLELENVFAPEWLSAALLQAPGHPNAKLRKRKLPLLQSLWLVIGMALFRDRSIQAVAAHLDLVLPEADGTKRISPGALPAARARLGAGPLEAIFDMSAQAWSSLHADKNTWRGLSIWAMDGTCFNLPETSENEAAFGRPKTVNPGPYPQARVVCLLNASTHVVAGFNVGAYREGELTLLDPLWERVPERSVTIVDRGLQSRYVFARHNSSGTEKHWLTREKKGTVSKHVAKLGPDDELIELEISRHVRERLPDAPRTLTVRRITSRVPGYRDFSLLTSMLDPKKYPAKEIAELYRQRWEIELAYNEVKNGLLETEITLRSKTPDGVRQELYATAIAYNLVRVELARIAAGKKANPLRMSFRNGLLFIRTFLLTAWQVPPGNLPRMLGSMESDLALLLLPERRARRYPRQIKARMGRYPYRQRDSLGRRLPAGAPRRPHGRKPLK